MSSRVEHIKKNYSLKQLSSGQWEASVAGCEWSDKRQIVGTDRAAVVREFRAHWGHLNFEDEARAFGEIFR